MRQLVHQDIARGSDGAADRQLIQHIAVIAQIEQHVARRGGQRATQHDGITAATGQERQGGTGKGCGCRNTVRARASAGQHIADRRERPDHTDLSRAGSGGADFKVTPRRDTAVVEIDDLGRGGRAVGKIKDNIAGGGSQCARNPQNICPAPGAHFNVAATR